MNTDAKSLQRELKGVNTLLKLDPKNVTLLKQKQDLLNKSIAQTQEKLAKLKQAQTEADQAIADGVKVNEEEYRNLQREIANTEQKLVKLTKEQREFASISLVQLQAVAREFKALGAKIAAAGEALLPLTAAIAAVGVASVAASIKFESSFAGVKKTVDATTEELEQLAEASREAALVKPVDVNDINYIMELGGQLGIASNQLSKFASVIGDLSVSTNLGVEDASMQLAQMMNIMGTEQTDIDRLGATIVALGNTSATTEATIADFAMRIAGSGNAIGMTESQVLGLSASLASVGIRAEMGGSAISTIMSQIDKDVAHNGESLEVWAETAGMSAEQFADAWETDAASALIALIGGMEQASLSGENLNLVLDDLGISNIRQTDTLKRLSSAASLMATTMNTANVAWEENTALTKEATQRYETTESKLIMMKNQVVDIAISIGNGLKSALAGAMDAIGPVLSTISNIAKVFEEADPNVQAFVISIGGLLVSAAPLLIITGKLTSGMGSMLEACAKSATALAAKAAATAVDTKATTTNTLALNAQIIRQSLKEVADARAAINARAKAAATTADTAATAANTAAVTANSAATGATMVQSTAYLLATKAKTIATTAATVAQVAWNAAMAANPIGAVVTAVAALTAIVGGVTLAISSTIDKNVELTETSRKQKEKVDELQKSYDSIVKAHGEHSDAALKAKYALEQEKAAFEATKETLSEFNEHAANTIKAHEDLLQSIHETTAEADIESGKILYLADQITALSEQESKSAEDKSKLASMTAELNAACTDLNLTYNEQTDTLNMSAEALSNIVEAQADQLRSEAAMQSYSDLLSEQVELEMQLAEAEQNLAAETERNVAAWGMFGETQVWTSQTQLDLEETVKNTNTALEENAVAQKQALEISAEYTAKQSALALAVEEVERGALSAEEAAEKYGKTVKNGISADEIRAEQAHKAAVAEAELEAQLNSTASSIKQYADAHGSFRTAMDLSGVSAELFADILVASGAEFEDVIKEIEEYSSSVASAFTKIADSSENTLSSLKETLSYNLEATQNWSANLESVFERAGVSFSEEFVNAVRAGGVGEFGTVMAELAQATDEELQEISDSFAEAGQAGVEAYFDEQLLLVPGTKQTLEQVGETVSNSLACEQTAVLAAKNTGDAYTQTLAESIAQAPEAVQIYIEELETQLAQAQSQAGDAGTITGNSYSQNLQIAISTCPTEVQAYIAQMEARLQQFNAQAAEIGTETGTEYAQNTATGMQTQSELITSTAASVNLTAQTALTNTDSAMNSGISLITYFAKGMTSALPKAASVALKGRAQTEKLLSKTKATEIGRQIALNLAKGMADATNSVTQSARNVTKACYQWAEFKTLAYVWGHDAGSQFAIGLNSTKSLVKKAATNIASTVRSILHFSVPDEGPLADADEYGPDFGMLFADGLRSKIGEIKAAASEAAKAAKTELNNELQKTSKAMVGIDVSYGNVLSKERDSLTASLTNITSLNSATNFARSAKQGAFTTPDLVGTSRSGAEKTQNNPKNSADNNKKATGTDDLATTIRKTAEDARKTASRTLTLLLDTARLINQTQETSENNSTAISKALEKLSEEMGTRSALALLSFESIFRSTISDIENRAISLQGKIQPSYPYEAGRKSAGYDLNKLFTELKNNATQTTLVESGFKGVNASLKTLTMLNKNNNQSFFLGDNLKTTTDTLKKLTAQLNKTNAPPTQAEHSMNLLNNNVKTLSAVLAKTLTQPFSLERGFNAINTDVASVSAKLANTLATANSVLDRQFSKANSAKAFAQTMRYISDETPLPNHLSAMALRGSVAYEKTTATSVTENNYYIDGINVNGTTNAQFAADFMALMQRYGRLART